MHPSCNTFSTLISDMYGILPACLKGLTNLVFRCFSRCVCLSVSLSPFEKRFPEPRCTRGSRKLGFVESCPWVWSERNTADIDTFGCPARREWWRHDRQGQLAGGTNEAGRIQPIYLSEIIVHGIFFFGEQFPLGRAR